VAHHQNLLLDRRRFLGSLAAVVTAGAVLTPRRSLAANGCGADKPRKLCVIRDGNLVATSVGCILFDHYHELQIPLAAIEAPPTEGLRLRTTTVSLHSHAVTLTQQELMNLAGGMIVVVSDTDVGEHEFTVQLPR
jgi:hypothetical protein